MRESERTVYIERACILRRTQQQCPIKMESHIPWCHAPFWLYLEESIYLVCHERLIGSKKNWGVNERSVFSTTSGILTSGTFVPDFGVISLSLSFPESYKTIPRRQFSTHQFYFEILSKHNFLICRPKYIYIYIFSLTSLRFGNLK